MRARICLLSTTALAMSGWATVASAQGLVEYNRRIESVSVTPTAGAPDNFYDVWIGLDLSRSQSIPTTLDLSTDIQVFANGATIPVAFDMVGAQFPLDNGCDADGCGNSFGCGHAIVDGATIPAFCKEFENDFLLPCMCTVSTYRTIPAVPLTPGDEIMVILYPAPGALPELPGIDDDDLDLVVSIEGSRSFCAGDGSGGACPCANFGGGGQGCENSTGEGGVLYASGSVSVAADDLVFHAQNLPGAQPALLYYGDAQLNGGDGLPFGDGLRCVGGSIVRLAVAQTNAVGDVSWGPGLVADQGWQANDVLDFQAWFRDPVGGPCLTGFNLTNGLEVVFTN